MLSRTNFTIIRKNVFLSWLLSYFILLLIPGMVSYLVFVNTSKIVEKEIIQANNSLLSLVKQTMDSRMSETKNLATQISLNSKVKSLALKNGDMTNDDWYALSELSKTLELYKSTNEFITDFYIYFNKADIVLSSAGSSYPEYLYRSFHKSSSMSYEQWKNVIKSKYNGQFVTMPILSSTDGKEEKAISYLYTVQMDEKDEPAATIAIFIKESDIIKAIDNVNWVNKGAVFVINHNNELMAATSPIEITEDLNYDRLRQGSLVYGNIKAHESVILTSIESKVADWKYVSEIPEKLFMEKVAYIRNMTYVGILICFIFGGIVAYIFTKRNYHPLKELIQLIAKRAGIDMNSSYNEYRYIKETLSDTFDEKDKANKTVKQQNAILGYNFLARLVKGRIDNSESISESLELFNIKYEYDNFAVLLFYLEDYSELFDESDNMDEEKKLKLVQFIISNVFEELTEEIGKGIVFEVEEMLACLVNVRDFENGQEMQEIKKIAHKAHSFISEKFKINFTISISDINHTVYSISAAYKQALNAMEYKILFGNQAIIIYNDIANTNNSEKVYYYLENDEILVNCIKAAEFEKAKEILDQVFYKNFSKGVISVQMAKCFMFGLINTMIKTMDEISVICDSSFIELLNPIDRLLKCSTLSEIQKEIIDILKNICDFIEVKRNSNSVKVKDEIVRFIEEHYTDENLSISMIADNFNVSMSYISRFFKEQFGEGTLDFINKLRIKKSKQLLLGQDLSISQIAERVGYYNSNTFIRVFKKYEGVTPGKYKECV